MRLYDLTTLHLTFSGIAQAPEAALRFLAESPESGRLLGCWRPEMAPLNRLVVLRAFDREEQLIRERTRVLMDSNPFGCAAVLTGIEATTYVPFDSFENIETGAFGPFYEVRTYHVKPGGLQALMPDWAAIAPARSAYSPLLLAMYALDGPCRMTHIWPYRDLVSRQSARSKAVAHCPGWPPPSGLDWLEPRHMESTVYLPVSGSPLC